MQKNPITLLLRKSRKKKFHVKKNFSAFSTNSLANSLNRNIYIPTGMYIIYNESTKMKELVKKIGELSIPLIVGIVAALAWANIDSYSYNDFIYRELAPGVNFHFLVNDVFLVLFFGSVSIEIVHGVAPGGNLYPIKNTVSNLLGALGGILLPIALFFSLNAFFGSPDYHNGWAIPTATDVAISLLFAQMIFGKKHPAFTFLLLLAIADDVVGLAIIALFYPDPELPVNPRWLSLVFVAVAVAWILNKHKVRSYWAYLLTGILSWAGLHEANMHPSLALIFIIPFIPHETEPGKERCQTELDRFESDFKPIVDYGLFFFGLSNASVVFSSISELTLIVFVSLLAGKTFGIYLMVKIAGLFKFRINNAITDLDLLLIGMTAGIGLTVSLFIAEIAYTDGSIADAAKMGALFSLFNGFIALAVAKLIRKEPEIEHI